MFEHNWNTTRRKRWHRNSDSKHRIDEGQDDNTDNNSIINRNVDSKRTITKDKLGLFGNSRQFAKKNVFRHWFKIYNLNEPLMS